MNTGIKHLIPKGQPIGELASHEPPIQAWWNDKLFRLVERVYEEIPGEPDKILVTEIYQEEKN